MTARHRRARGSVFPFLAILGAAACNDSIAVVDLGGGGAGAGEDGAGGAGGEAFLPAPEITWVACENEDVPGFSCADVPVPLDWANPNGATTSVRMRRMPASVDPPRGSVWLLEGGPGAPGAWMLSFAARTAAAHPDLDVMVVDHRGTGGSGELRCEPSTDPPTASCLAELLAEHGADRIGAVSTTAAARDVAALTRWFGRGESQILYGRSYGTYWAHRVVSLDPKPFTGLVLDSPCAAGGCPAATRDAEVDLVGRKLLALCDLDPTCASRLPGGAEAFAEGVVSAADAGACAGAAATGFDGERLRHALGRLVGSQTSRALVPAILFRYQRCSSEDVLALQNLALYLETFDMYAASAPGFSQPTNYHISRSEFWDPSFTVADAEAQLEGTIIATGASVRWARAFASWPWPVVEVEPTLHDWHFPAAPTLVIVGGLDAATPAHLVADVPASLGPGSTYLELALADHVSSVDETPSGACARDTLDAFFDDPTAALDLGCAAAAETAERPALFEPDAETTLLLFGTASAYD